MAAVTSHTQYDKAVSHPSGRVWAKCRNTEYQLFPAVMSGSLFGRNAGESVSYAPLLFGRVPAIVLRTITLSGAPAEEPHTSPLASPMCV